MRRAFLALFVVVALAACGADDSDTAGSCGPNDNCTTTTAITRTTTIGSDPSTTPTSTPVGQEESDYPSCREWQSRAVSADEVEFGCDQGGNTIAGTALYPCDDGRTLYWNDAGWGYVGEPMHAHQAGAQQVAPESERTACPA